MSRIAMLVTGSLILCWAPAAFGDSAEDERIAEMQKQLNAEVMAKPFSVEEEAQILNYIQEATKRNLVPPPYKGMNWRKGSTCRDLRAFSYDEYRSCRFYHSYHGRYYPYPD